MCYRSLVSNLRSILKAPATPGDRPRGAIAPLAALMLVMIFAFVAFSVDVGYIAFTKSCLQAAADASAMAAAMELSSGSAAAVHGAARSVASANDRSGSGGILADSDIQLGIFDATKRTFTPVNNTASANAVRVTTRYAQANGNPLKLFFGPVLGVSTAELTTTATAMMTSSCFSKGIICGDKLQIGDSMTLSNFCAYGRQRVELGSSANVINGSKVGSLPSSVIQYGGGANGLPQNIFRGDLQPTLANDVQSLISQIQAGTNLPPQISHVQVISSWPPPGGVQSGTAYVVNTDVSIMDAWSISNVIIAAQGTIHLGETGALTNTGNPTSDIAIGLFATYDVQIGEKSSVKGVNLVAGHDIQIGQNLGAFEVGTMQACNDVQLGQSPVLTGFGSVYDPGQSTPQLVQ